jgi:hypothetical protein
LLRAVATRSVDVDVLLFEVVCDACCGAVFCANYGYFRENETTPNPLANTPKEARTTSHVWRVTTPFIKSESDPRKQAAPTTQIALVGTVLLVPGEGAEVLGLSSTKSAMNIAKNNASASVRDPFWTSQYTPRRIGALTMNAIKSLLCAAGIFVIGIDHPCLLRGRRARNRRPRRGWQRRNQIDYVDCRVDNRTRTLEQVPLY